MIALSWYQTDANTDYNIQTISYTYQFLDLLSSWRSETRSKIKTKAEFIVKKVIGKTDYKKIQG